MSATTKTPTAGDTSSHPASPERGEHSADSVLSLTTGAGLEHSKEECVSEQPRPARPVRFADPARNAAYWARIDRIVDAAPPLTDEQRATIRAAFHQPKARRAA